MELVSPSKKDGQYAGGDPYNIGYSRASDDGNSFLFSTAGPVGADPPRGVQNYALSRRDADGWASTAPLPLPATGWVSYNQLPYSVVPSSDLNRIAFVAAASLVPENPPSPPSARSSAGLYVTDTRGSTEWATRPTAADAFPAPGQFDSQNDVANVLGGSQDLRTLYFSSYGTLVPEDAPRRPNITAPALPGAINRGLYRYEDGTLTAAGVLPDGTVDPYGAAPAGGLQTPGQGIATGPDDAGNQVSEDGRRAFFVSPDPAGPLPGGRVPELYVRIDNDRTVLVSRSKLTGEPAQSGVASTTLPTTQPGSGSYAFASPDGSTVVFRSVDALTDDAPDDGTKKAYVFDVDDQSLRYVPGLYTLPSASSRDGSTMLVVGGQRGQSDGGNGEPNPVALLRSGTLSLVRDVSVAGPVRGATASVDGSAFVFETPAALDGFDGGGFRQVYRVDAASGDVDCLSCLPAGTSPSGDARVGGKDGGYTGEIAAPHVMSADGTRVFFESPDALLAADTNGRRDIYEWTKGSGLELVTSGTGSADARLLDNSPSGDDVYFVTSESLVPEDTDGNYDVYDARVGGGFTSDSGSECAGDDCQGPVTSVGPAPAPRSDAPAPITIGPRDGRGATRRVTVKVRSARSSATAVTIRAQVSGPGTLKVTGSRLARASRKAGKAGTYTVTARLSRTARRSLARTGRLTVTARISFAPANGKTVARTAKLTIKRPRR